MELEKGLYAYPWQGQGNNCNSYAIAYEVDGQRRFALIDPGLLVALRPVIDMRGGQVVSTEEEPALEPLLAALRQDGIEPRAIGLVINTHAHPDHCQANPFFKKAGARLAMHREDEPLYLARMQQGPKREDPAAYEVDFYLQEGEFVLGRPRGITLRIVHTPGHSPGSISLYYPEKKAVLVGDVVYYRNVGRFDLPGGSAQVLKESIEKLARLDTQYLLSGHAYGHPGIITGRDEIQANFRYVLNLVLG